MQETITADKLRTSKRNKTEGNWSPIYTQPKVIATKIKNRATQMIY